MKLSKLEIGQKIYFLKKKPVKNYLRIKIKYVVDVGIIQSIQKNNTVIIKTKNNGIFNRHVNTISFSASGAKKIGLTKYQ